MNTALVFCKINTYFSHTWESNMGHRAMIRGQLNPSGSIREIYSYGLCDVAMGSAVQLQLKSSLVPAGLKTAH